MALYVLLAFAAIGLGGRALASLARLLSSADRAEAPFRLVLERVTRVEPAGEEAGLRRDDRVVSVEGQALVGRRGLALALARTAPGAVLELEVERANGQRERLRVPTHGSSVSRSDRLLGLVLAVFLPLFCVVLGFYVAFRRPDDLRAWLLLGLLLGFATIFNSEVDPASWPRPLAWAALGFSGLFNALWPVFMLLFGIHFPERLAFDRRHPWVAWVWLAPLVALAPLGALGEVAAAESYAAARALLAPDRLLGSLPMALTLGSIGGFFALLAYKSSVSPAPDTRRRLRLLWSGASLSFTPMFVLVLSGLARGRGLADGVPPWVLALALLLLALFPLTLAYTIVVERALDLGVVIRQGLQYALARNGIFALRLVLSIAVLATAATLAADPTVNRPRRLMFMAAGTTLVILVQRAGEKLKAFTDRRFFREALDTERLLQALAEDVRTMVDGDELLEAVSGRLSDALHAPRVAVFLEREGAFVLVRGRGLGAPLPDLSLPADGELARRLRAEERPLLVYPDDPRSWVRELPERDGLQRVQAQALVPLRVGRRLSGFLALGPKLSEEAYAPSDLRLLRVVGDQVALALEHARLTAQVADEAARRARDHRELEIAREVQEQLFPQELPRAPGLELAGHCRPARGVGGDYYDFLALGPDRLGLAIGDVSGKGIPAALLMASLQASLRGQASFGTRDLAELMERVNKLICASSSPNRYATFFYAEYSPSTRRLTYVNAGHNAPMLLRADGRLERLEAGGPVVGLIEFASYTAAEVELRPGDLLLGYTDGLSEAMNPAEEEWGEERLSQALRACDGTPAAQVVERLMAGADAFAAGAPQHDDMTLLVVRAQEA